MPELKRLSWDEEFGRVELENIISVCPNLIELVYRNTAIPSPLNYKKLRWDTLRSLKLSPRDELRDEYVLALTCLKLKLQRLTLFGVTPTMSAKTRMDNLRRFLKSISSTLCELELFQHHSIDSRYDPTHESPFPVALPKLKRLKVDFPILKTLKAINSMPELETFECKAKYNDWGALSKKGYPAENLNLNYLNLGCFDKNSLLKFSQAFKVVTNLELYPELIDDKAMRVIISGFPQLQQLKIAKLCHNSKLLPLTDSGLTGFLPTTCVKLSKTMNFRNCNTLKEKKFPAIYDLTGGQFFQSLNNNLHKQTFHKQNTIFISELIRLEVFAEESALTDLAVVYGICKCTKLAILGLPKSKVC